MTPAPTRRTFLNTAALAAAPLIVPAHIAGFGGLPSPNGRINVGCIGVGPRGQGVMRNFLHNENARVLAVCDVKAPRVAEAKKRVDDHYGNQDCATYGDAAELLARTDIDAVLVGSTDHWHVQHALMAARAGKDMYVEKPLALGLNELHALRDTVHRHGVLFQFGTQQRSAREFRFACELVRNGRIGALRRIRVGVPPSIEQPIDPPAEVPDWLNYDLWLGPAPWLPYTRNRVQNVYWWHNSNFALGFVAGWGIHHVDIAQWGNGTDDTGPVAIEGTGTFPREGACDCATAWTVHARYANGVELDFRDNAQNPQGVVFEGDEGRVYVKRGYLETEPEALLRDRIGANELHLYESASHVGNLLDCMRTRSQTVCPIDTAVRSDTICLISDIAMRSQRPLKWDPLNECFEDDDAANRMLTRGHRGPWRF